MNKKILTIGAAIVISGTLMITSAFAAMSTTSAGYDALKAAHKKAHLIESLTTTAKLTIIDRGQSVLDLQSKFKIDGNKANGSGVISVNQDGATHDINIYLDQAQKVLKTSDSDTYYVIDHDSPHSPRNDHRNSHDPAMTEDAERIIDALVGNYQNYFQLDETSGNSSVVKFSMHDDEIPLIVNTLGSILIKNASKQHSTPTDMEQHPVFKQLHAVSLPELTEDIRLKGIDLKAVINSDQFIEEYDMLIQASGTDAEGVIHELEFKLQLNFSDFNQTQADEIDLDGKSVEQLEADQLFKQHR